MLLILPELRQFLGGGLLSIWQGRAVPNQKQNKIIAEFRPGGQSIEPSNPDAETDKRCPPLRGGGACNG
jgi:hypothetical protein